MSQACFASLVVTPPGLPATLKLFPACDHAEGIEHLQRFSVGLIPFKRNRLTAGIDPIKYYGYRGMGLPVLTTAFGEMAARGPADGAYLLDEGVGLEMSVYAALGAHIDAAAVTRFREEHSWTRRFDDAKLFER